MADIREPYHLFSEPLRYYNQMIQDIESAKKYIFIETFRVGRDEIGDRFRRALTRKAKDGVDVRILIDYWGAGSVNHDYFSRLIKHGGEVRFFEKIKYNTDIFTRGHKRNHRKLMLIDDEISWIGSSNLTAYNMNWRESMLRIKSGGMTFTFIKAKGGNIGDSICEDDKMELALDILKQAKSKSVQIHLPVDVIAADAFRNDALTQIVDANKIPDGWQGLDCGPKSIVLFDAIVNQCKTILWNGPLGVFEMKSFANGTIALGDSIAKATKNGAFSLVGGGDSVAAVKQFGFEDKVSYVSTGGGAMLESLEGKTLPGIAAILN